MLGYTKNKKIIKNPVISSKLNEYLDNPIITGEKLQNFCDVYLGLDEDFKYNPFFYSQKVKQYNIRNIGNNNESYDNPRIIFCFTHRIDILSKNINFFQNNFILVTHNSDKNIEDTESVRDILNSDKLEKWYTQNLYIDNKLSPYDKLNILPIGIGNTQWKHGKDFISSYLDNLKSVKDKKVYMSFNINTNKGERQSCYNSLNKKIPFLSSIDTLKNFKRMSTYQYCICPIGNGVDTHRFWEALYLKLVPIVVRNPFYTILEILENKIPIIILNSWDEFDLNNLPNYKSFNFNNTSLTDMLNINYYKSLIKVL